jgi:NTP pyrophosphatase (non-canonical NTP hydrolase)
MTSPDVTRQTVAVLDDVSRERRDQDHRWGEQRYEPPVWLAILTEEVGEAAKEIAEGWAGGEWDPAAYRKELVHVAAVAVAAIEALDHGAAGLGRGGDTEPEPDPTLERDSGPVATSTWTWRAAS